MAAIQPLFVEGDTSPDLTGVVTYGGAVVNLTGATVVLRMKRPDATILTRTATVTNAAAGAWSYAWQDGELTKGTWWVDIEATAADSSLQTFPVEVSMAFKVRARQSGGAGVVTPVPQISLDLSNLTGMDAAIAGKVGTPGSATDLSLKSTYVPGASPQKFGAVGNGVHDDTTAMQAWLDSVPTGGGLLHLPVGKYLVPNGGLTCAKPVHIMGAGMGAYETANGGSRILCSSTTATLLTLTAPGAVVTGVTFENTAAMGTNTAGAAILATDFDWGHIERCMFVGFWNQLQIDNGFFYTVQGNKFLRPVNYGAYCRALGGAGNVDHGDWGFINNVFSKFGDPTDGGTALRWESGGGLRLIGNKVNSASQPGYPSTGFWGRGFDIQLEAAAATSVCIISGNSIEGMKTGQCIYIKGGAGATFGKITINANELFQCGSFATIEIIGTGMVKMQGIAITGNVLTGGFVRLKDITSVVITGNDGAYNGGTALQLDGVDHPVIGLNRWAGVVFDYDSSTYATGRGHERDPWAYRAEIRGLTTNAGYGYIIPATFSASVMTITVRGDMSGLGGSYVRKSRVITKTSPQASTCVVGATVGADVAAGPGAGETQIDFDVTTVVGQVIPRVTSSTGRNLRAVIDVTYEGPMAEMLYPWPT